MDQLPSASPYLFKLPHPPETAPLPGDQLIKHMSLAQDVSHSNQEQEGSLTEVKTPAWLNLGFLPLLRPHE